MSYTSFKVKDRLRFRTLGRKRCPMASLRISASCEHMCRNMGTPDCRRGDSLVGRRAEWEKGKKPPYQGYHFLQETKPALPGALDMYTLIPTVVLLK